MYLNNHLTTNSLLDQNQFGFHSGRSTLDQLLTYNGVSLLTDIGMTVADEGQTWRMKLRAT